MHWHTPAAALLCTLHAAQYAMFVSRVCEAFLQCQPLSLVPCSVLCSGAACRKAYRLGKFLQDVNGLRKVKLSAGHLALLELVVYLGEGTYYFLDQFTW